MKTKLDRFGRVLIPKVIRDRFGWLQGSDVGIDTRGNFIVLKPIDPNPPLIRKKGVLVYTGEAKGDLREAVRMHRHRGKLGAGEMGRESNNSFCSLYGA